MWLNLFKSLALILSLLPSTISAPNSEVTWRWFGVNHSLLLWGIFIHIDVTVCAICGWFLLLFLFLVALQGLWDLSSPTRIKPGPSAVEHWALTTGLPGNSLLLVFLCFFFNFLFYSGVYLMNNVLLVSGLQQSDSVIHIHISILFQILFPFRLLHDIEQSFLASFDRVQDCLLFALLSTRLRDFIKN